MDKIFTPIKQRVLKIADTKEIKRGVFFKKLNVHPSNFRSKSLYSEVNGSLLAKISSIYSDVNIEWLLTGKGSMLKGVNESQSFLEEKMRFIERENELLHQINDLRIKLSKIEEDCSEFLKSSQDRKAG